MALKSQLTTETANTTKTMPNANEDEIALIEEEGAEDELTSKSDLAQEVSSLKDSVTKVIKERGRLPQPLFWSLFNSKIKELRERKESSRRLEELLSKLE